MPFLFPTDTSTIEGCHAIIEHHIQGLGQKPDRFYYLCDDEHYMPGNEEDETQLAKCLNEDDSLDISFCTELTINLTLNYFGYHMNKQYTIQSDLTAGGIIEDLYPQLTNDYLKETYTKDKFSVQLDGQDLAEGDYIFEKYCPNTHEDKLALRLTVSSDEMWGR